MRIYLIKHKNTKTLSYNLEAYVDVKEVQFEETRGFYVSSVKAFLKKKHAQEYIDSLPETVRPYREIVPFESVN